VMLAGTLSSRMVSATSSGAEDAVLLSALSASARPVVPGELDVPPEAAEDGPARDDGTDTRARRNNGLVLRPAKPVAAYFGILNVAVRGRRTPSAKTLYDKSL